MSKKSFAEQLKQLKRKAAQTTQQPANNNSLHEKQPVNRLSSSNKKSRKERLQSVNNFMQANDAPLSDDEIFEKALEELSPDKIYRGKYEGDGLSGHLIAPTKPLEEPVHDERRELVLQVREEKEFENAIGPVEKVEGADKYYRPSPVKLSEISQKFLSDIKNDTAEAVERPFVTPALPHYGEGLNELPPLDQSQRALLKRFKAYAKRPNANIPELNVRGDSAEVALRSFEQFLQRVVAQNQSAYIRIIHGRGLRSENESVLKPAIIQWIEENGQVYIRGYIPELQSSGDYGSLIVELK